LRAFGVPGDPDRILIFTGSPQWYAGCLMALRALGVVAALLHDREHPRGRCGASAPLRPQ